MRKTIDRVTGAFARGWYEALTERPDEGGCCHLEYASDDRYRYSVCMGWADAYDTPDGPRWAVAWKIGRQTHNNIMQCDIDVDFEMPYDEDTGEVDDTWRLVDQYRSWAALAREMREEARRVFRTWKRKGGTLHDSYR